MSTLSFHRIGFQSGKNEKRKIQQQSSRFKTETPILLLQRHARARVRIPPPAPALRRASVRALGPNHEADRRSKLLRPKALRRSGLLVSGIISEVEELSILEARSTGGSNTAAL